MLDKSFVLKYHQPLHATFVRNANSIIHTLPIYPHQPLMSEKQQDFRAHEGQRPLLPRFMRHPVQTPHIPPSFMSIAFLSVALIVFTVGLFNACRWHSKKQMNLLIFIKILATLACACVLVYGVREYFVNEQYDMGENAVISGVGVLCALVLLL